MTYRTLVPAVLLLAFAGTPVWSAEYLPDVLKNPTYLSSWNKLIASKEHDELWLKHYGESFNGPSIPSAHVTLSDGTYTIAWVCQAHNCGPRQFFVLFAPDGKTAWGILLKDTNENAVFGNPNDERLSVIRQYIRTGW